MTSLSILLLLIILYLYLFFKYRPDAQKEFAEDVRREKIPNPNEFYKSKEEINFGKDFKFGTSTAAYQIENIKNGSNWSLFEKAGKTPKHGEACDALNHYKEDIESMRKMEMSTYRFGVSWSDLEPERGRFNEEKFREYADLIYELRKANIEPIVTIYHFEHPEWLEKEGGILSGEEFVERLYVFGHEVGKRLSDVRYFITINEPNVMSVFGYLFGKFPPGHKSLSECFEAIAQLMRSHARIYTALKDINIENKVSFALNVTPTRPMHNYSVLETMIAKFIDQFTTSIYNSLASGVLEFKLFGINLYSTEIKNMKIDFFGINHYFYQYITLNPMQFIKGSPLFGIPQCFYKSDFGWPLAVDSLSRTVVWVNRRWNSKKLPILITENGIADDHDFNRQWFLRGTLSELSKTQKKLAGEGVELIGYCHWSLLDNYEWADGYKMRFGLIQVDYATQERTFRKSADIYRKIVQQSSKY